MLKQTRRAQRMLAKRVSTARPEAISVPAGVRQARRLLDLHLCDFHALASRCSDRDTDVQAIEALFGLDAATLETLKRVMSGHVARSATIQGAGVIHSFSPPAAERRAYRALFQGMSRVTTSLTIEVAHHSARVLAEVDGFQPPKSWTKGGEASVRALLGLAKAGVSRLRAEERPASSDGTTDPGSISLSWEVTSQGIDLNRHWIPTVVLALLRSRAAFQVAAAMR